MKEIGGYFELDAYFGKMLHDDGIKLNSGRNALAYLIKAKKITKLYMPFFMCDACDDVLKKNGVEVVRYHIGLDFKPIIDKRNGWLYLVNFYGQLDNHYLKTLGENIIVDNAHAYFQKPIDNVDTIYTCRKFFGVPDGSILFTDKQIGGFGRDESFKKMTHILGRTERTASEFYKDYIANENAFANEKIKYMSYLTENLLHKLNYGFIKKRRSDNFKFLHQHFSAVNKLKKLSIPVGAYAYPLYLENGYEIRKELINKKIYVPLLWPSVFLNCKENDLEWDMAKNILPIPIDQRYNLADMQYIVDTIFDLIKNI